MTGGFGHLIDFSDPAAATERTSPQPGSGGTTVQSGSVVALIPRESPARVLTFAVDALRVPTGRTDHGVDLVGDGTPDNRLGDIAGALTAQNIDMQSWVNRHLESATRTLLLRVATEHTDLAKDQRADVTIAIGTPIGARGQPDRDPKCAGRVAR